MLEANTPALILAPMDGITDAPMRSLLGESGAFTFGVTEFLRVSEQAIPHKVFHRDIPELRRGALTSSGMPVQVQLLGGDPERMAESAYNAWQAGATAIDINFGCPAPTVNRNDGGASLLKHPERIRQVVSAVRQSLPASVPLSAKLRLGWDCIDDIHMNAAMAAEGGASWLTIHARTRLQGYAPPVFWKPIGQVREALGLPIVANGDVLTLEHFRQCRQETGCIHFMIGRGALANPALAYEIARELGIGGGSDPELDWTRLLQGLVRHSRNHPGRLPSRTFKRLKQWLKMASKFGDFPHFEAIKQSSSEEALFAMLAKATRT